MILGKVETWPSSLQEFLASEHDMLLAHAQHVRETMDAYINQIGEYVPMAPNPHSQARERSSLRIVELLRCTTIRGWHCKRLTEHEVEHIAAHGLQPPNPQVLRERIWRAQADRMIEVGIAERLIAENQAGDENRKGMIWFCFFGPRIAGQSGIERFFRRWGGEALYNSHEDDPVTGNELRLIGRPSLIEVDVPVSTFSPYTYLGDKVIRRYLLTRGYDTGEDCEHEDTSRVAVPAANIVRFLFHGEPEFAALTSCDWWKSPLDH